MFYYLNTKTMNNTKKKRIRVQGIKVFSTTDTSHVNHLRRSNLKDKS